MPVIYDDKKPIILDYLVCPQCTATLHPQPIDSFEKIEDYIQHLLTRQGVVCANIVGVGDAAKPCGWQGHVVYGRRSLS